MRGWDARSDALFSYVSCEARVPKDHPLRPIQRIVDEALAALSPEFEKLYARFGRPSIPPERLLRALLLQAFYSVRSEKQLVEQLEHNLLFRWVVGLSLDAEVWDETVFTKNRDRQPRKPRGARGDGRPDRSDPISRECIFGWAIGLE
jgi:transposase